jgi:hypothetical protein
MDVTRSECTSVMDPPEDTQDWDASVRAAIQLKELTPCFFNSPGLHPSQSYTRIFKARREIAASFGRFKV